MPVQFHIAENKQQLVHHFAHWLKGEIASTLEKKFYCTIALSGGSTPLDLFKLLATSPFNHEIDWEKVHVFWGDERDVPFNDERNNALQAIETLLSKVAIPLGQMHIINTQNGAEAAALAYDKLLHKYFEGRTFSFDITLLGMGDDGHTLSIFPNTEAVEEKEKWVMSYYVPTLQMNRITLLPAIINKSKQICFLVSGKNKAEVLIDVLYSRKQPKMYPAKLIKPLNGQLHWFLDKDAAGENDLQLPQED